MGCNCEAGRAGKAWWHSALAESIEVAFERLGVEDDGDAAPGDELPVPKSTNPDDVMDPRDELMTALRADIQAIPVGSTDDVAGRLWDMLWMAACVARGASGGGRRGRWGDKGLL